MIENLINRNKDSFNLEDLPEGHVERFEEKLNMAFPNSKNISLNQILMVAASILIFISTLTFVLINMKYTLPDKQILTYANPEMYEAERFYMDAISEKINILTKKQKMNFELSSDLKEIDKNIKNLSKDIKLNPGDERIISAVINVYQSKLDLLDDLITHIR